MRKSAVNVGKRKVWLRTIGSEVDSGGLSEKKEKEQKNAREKLSQRGERGPTQGNSLERN